jgi:hypothetical protein
MKLEFSLRIFENTQMSFFLKIRPVGEELFHADGRTDMAPETHHLTSWLTKLW